jgi:hypothetical protein
MLSDVLDPSPLFSDKLPGLVRPMKRAAFPASITEIHIVFVPKELGFVVDRRRRD